MSERDVLFGYSSSTWQDGSAFSAASRTFGVHRSTYYRWERMIERHGLGFLRPRETRTATDAHPALRVKTR